MPYSITFAQLVVWFYGFCFDTSSRSEEDLREEMQHYYLESYQFEWEDTFWRLNGATDNDVVILGLTVSQVIVHLLAEQVKKFEEMSMAEWWAFSFVPHQSLRQRLHSNDAAIHLQPQPPVPTWSDEDRAAVRRTCAMCGTAPRHDVNVRLHHAGDILCQNCVDTNYNGFW